MREEEINPFDMRELWIFQNVMMRRKYTTTVCLSVFIAFLFILENLWGGPSYIPTIYRMGANSQAVLSDYAVWRLCTSIFLHGNWVHIGFNVYVLIVLGSFFDRVLGGPKFLALFVLSGLCGSLASVFLSHAPVSLGASGSLWGIFGASAALTMRPSPYLPNVLRLRIRKMTLINILINLGFSLLPMVDIWAHLGGGIGGYLLGLLLMRFEVRRLSLLNSADASSVRERLRTYWLHPLVVLSVAIIAASFLFGYYQQQPWKITEKVHFKTRLLGESGLGIGVPDFLPVSAQPQESDGTTTYSFGVLPFDPYVLNVIISPLERPIAQDNLEEELDALKSQMPNYGFEGYRPMKAPRRYVVDGFPTGADVYQNKIGVTLFVWYQIRHKEAVYIELVALPDTPQVLVENLDDIMKSLKQYV